MSVTSKAKVFYKLHRGSFSISLWERELIFDRVIPDSQKKEELVFANVRRFHHPDSQLSLESIEWL